MNTGKQNFSGLNLYYYNTIFKRFSPENYTISVKLKSKKGKHLLKKVSFFWEGIYFYLIFYFIYTSKLFILTS